jgi:hypothetical protein
MLVLALTGSSREHPNGDGFSANLFDGLKGQAKPASEGGERTPILTHRERTRQGPPDLFAIRDVILVPPARRDCLSKAEPEPANPSSGDRGNTRLGSCVRAIIKKRNRSHAVRARCTAWAASSCPLVINPEITPSTSAAGRFWLSLNAASMRVIANSTPTMARS